MQDFWNRFEEYCKTPGVESGKARSYVKAIQYLCDYLEIREINDKAIAKIKHVEDSINYKDSVFYCDLLIFLSGRGQKSYLEKGYIKAALKYLFLYQQNVGI